MKTVVIVGATGLFGGHLARQLIDDGRFHVVCAGRSKDRILAFTSQYGGQPMAFDRNQPEAILAQLRPFAVVDVAGPFQEYGNAPYQFATACLQADAHYIDIADDPVFVGGIKALNSLAHAKGLTALSGASTTPALSSAVVHALSSEMDHISQIETTILPGNKTPRGLSVMRAILGQIGQRFPIWEEQHQQSAIGWSRLAHTRLQVGNIQLSKRPASLVNTPDILLAQHFNADTVIARAGLELGLFHHSLRFARFTVQSGLLRSLVPLAKPAFHLASLFQKLGSDAGGMRVRVIGRQNGQTVQREWDLIAPDGHGPKIPVQPIAVMLEKYAVGTVSAGARPCIGEIPLSELETAMAKFGAISEIR